MVDRRALRRHRQLGRDADQGNLAAGAPQFPGRVRALLDPRDAYFYLVADPFPSFAGKPGYPIDLEIDPPQPQNRWKTAFRIILVIPAAILNQVLQYVVQIIGFLGWFVCLALGRMPQGMRDLSAYCLRFQAQTYAYLAVLTDRYPSLAPDLPPARRDSSPMEYGPLGGAF